MTDPWELSDQQLMLFEKALFYKSINEMSPVDRPEDKIIEDDEALDRWFETFTKQQARQAAMLRKQSAQRQPNPAPVSPTDWTR